MKTKVRGEVRGEITRAFGSDAGPIMVVELEAADIPLEGESPDRVHMAVVYGSAGDVHRFRELVGHATVDAREMLEVSGLDGEDWREVLRKSGHWAPEG